MSEPGARLAAALAAASPPALPALIPYVTAGFPQLDDTPRLLAVAQEAGCAAAEIGIPFSDPLADGPTIQKSGTQALRNGMTPALAIEQVKTARASGVSIPLAVMTYVNPILAWGTARFAEACANAGIDAVIVPDLPSGEAGDMRAVLNAAGVGLVPMVAPTTTPARLDTACAAAQGFVYCVAITGVTGRRETVPEEALALLDSVGQHTRLPRCLGFGISRHDHVRTLIGHAEGAIVGSALIDVLADADTPFASADSFLRSLLGVAAS